MKSCPRCSHALDEIEFAGVRVDGCHGCGGVWFDNQELNQVAKRREASLTELEDRFLPDDSQQKRESRMDCPACGARLYEFEFEHTPGIKLDACPLCKGIWVDDGELQAIHTRLVQAVVSAPNPAPAPPTSPRHRASQASGFLTSVQCPRCNRPNPSVSFACWACGARLAEARKTLCPNCDHPLVTKIEFGVPVDLCETCSGVWLDVGELSVLARQQPDDLRKLEPQKPEGRVAVSEMWDKMVDMLCPSCGIPMQEEQYAYSSGVRIDTCSQCNGVWVGGGKLAQISQYYGKALGKGIAPA